MIGDDYYLIRQLDAATYEIAKFNEFVREPDALYVVNYQEGYPNRTYCDCMGYRRSPGDAHKHVKLVKEFLRLGRPWLTVFTLSPDNNVWHYSILKHGTEINPHDMWLGRQR